ncbi:MAG: ACP S-malonyltransferase, partial [Selenomonadaceae bacterium]|nr:ACP S-malonyltransferase [Selenomonadaceae bacterium]
MNKTAFIFPGQGAQTIGMGKDFYDNFDAAKKLFDEADDALSYSIRKMCFEGSEDDLKLTENTQPAILVVSVIVNELLKSEGVTAQIAGGHSLGEYSALVAAGTLKFSDAVVLVHKRGKFMQEAVPVGEGSMAAIIGLDDETIIQICAEVSSIGEVQAVNFNCPGQTVIAGKTAGVEAAVDKLKSAGAKK